jgi:putative restriction endonuclease
LAKLLGRTPSAVSWKLANFARLDPELQERNIAGARHGSKADVQVWNDFHQDWARLSFESEQLLANMNNIPIEEVAEIPKKELLKKGKELERIVRTRVNQKFFRKMVLASYDYRCCITGLPIPELLIASHIVPWAVDEKNRLNPKNGLCLNALHDYAFDNGFLTITCDYKVRLCTQLRELSDEATLHLLSKYDGVKIRLPQRFVPDLDFLRRHNNKSFRG